ncbi:MAG: hypothetical protein PWR07_2215 [Bacillota bacterium]|nr:hypothetical protein [Bacillota bacterium]
MAAAPSRPPTVRRDSIWDARFPLELKCPEFRTHSDDSDHAGGLAHVSSECLVQLQIDSRLHRGAACACTTERTAMRQNAQPCGRAESHAVGWTAVRRGGRPPRGISGWKAYGKCARLSRLCAPADRCRLLGMSRTLAHVDARWRTPATVGAAFEALPQAG